VTRNCLALLIMVKRAAKRAALWYALGVVWTAGGREKRKSIFENECTVISRLFNVRRCRSFKLDTWEEDQPTTRRASTRSESLGRGERMKRGEQKDFVLRRTLPDRVTRVPEALKR
jgi:hypothetical protein